MKHQHIMVAISLDKSMLRPLYEWGRSFDFSSVETIQFVHVVKKNLTALEFGLVEMPDDETFLELKPALTKFMEDEAKKILPPRFTGKAEFYLTKSYNPQEEVVNLIKENHVSLIVVSTKERHGLENIFHHSFTNHMVRHAPCDVFVVKPLLGDSISDQSSPSL